MRRAERGGGEEAGKGEGGREGGEEEEEKWTENSPGVPVLL